MLLIAIEKFDVIEASEGISNEKGPEDGQFGEYEEPDGKITLLTSLT